MTFDVVCLGILVADVIARPFDELPPTGTLAYLTDVSLRGGGCALNTATVLTRFGCSSAVGGKIGDDPLGGFLTDLLDERRIDRRSVVRDETTATSATVVLVDSSGERTFLHMKGANAELRSEELDLEAMCGGRCLHVAGALVMDAFDGEPCAAVLETARRRGALTSIDTVWDPSGRWERILPCLPHVDVFAASLAEAQAISGQDDAESAAAWLKRAGARDVVVKLGADGCFVAGSGLVGPVAVSAVDGTGAGDAFMAGLLYGILNGWSIVRSARLGNAAGALATTAVGATEGVPGLQETMALAGFE